MISKKILYFFSEDHFCLDPMKCHIMQHFIWVFTVCQSQHLLPFECRDSIFWTKQIHFRGNFISHVNYQAW